MFLVHPIWNYGARQPSWKPILCNLKIDANSQPPPLIAHTLKIEHQIVTQTCALKHMTIIFYVEIG